LHKMGLIAGFLDKFMTGHFAGQAQYGLL